MIESVCDLIEILLYLGGLCGYSVLVNAEILEEWSAAFIGFTFQLCLCSAVAYEHERSYGCTNDPRHDSSHAYSFHRFSPCKFLDWIAGRELTDVRQRELVESLSSHK